MYRPTIAQIDRAAVRDNVARIGQIAGTDVCAVVKADGYGHGAVDVATAAIEGGARMLAVALVEEGEQLRRAGVDAEVLLLTEPPVAALDAMVAARLTPLVYSHAAIVALAAIAQQQKTPLSVHVKVDTGMGRVGVPEAQWEDSLRWLTDSPLAVTGIATHLACADEPGNPVTAHQQQQFARYLSMAADSGLDPVHVHAANTAGALAHPNVRHTMVRAGIGIYGLSPSREIVAADYGLRPALRLRSEVSYVKRISAGTPVSYGHRWKAPVDGWIATVPIGYADGVPRALTNRVHVLIGGDTHPMVGTVCMDQVLVWCGETAPSVGDEVVLIGDGLPAEHWADAAETITYEIATGITARVPRKVVA